MKFRTKNKTKQKLIVAKRFFQTSPFSNILDEKHAPTTLGDTGGYQAMTDDLLPTCWGHSIE